MKNIISLLISPHSKAHASNKRRIIASLFTHLSTSVLLGLSVFAMTGQNVQAEELPKLRTNQAFVEEHSRKTTLDIKNVMSVFTFVLNSLPDKVTVYPTENYYYFSFIHQGLKYVGNLRLDASDRDKGVVHFAYFRQYTAWQRGEDPIYKLLGRADGVKVEKKNKLAYAISHKDKTVLFNLVDLSNVRPPEGLLHAKETYIGPVYDESGIQFFLVFNKDLKIFHYILNETVPVGESLFKGMVSDRILIGSRTGFAYYKDKFLDRKILIGVNEANSNVNNYYDGPFDQLPDNFIEGDVLKNAILAVQPQLKGNIDRLGNSPGGETRFFIGPYLHYAEETQLAMFERCAGDPKATKDVYYSCFTISSYENPYGSEESEMGSYYEQPPQDGENTGQTEKTAPKPVDDKQ